MENHALIVEIDPGCLLAKAGVEVGDVLDELCGEHIFDNSHGKVSAGLGLGGGLGLTATHVCVCMDCLPLN